MKLRFRLKHEGAASTQRPPLTSVEVRTHPDAQPRFPLFSSVTHHYRSESAGTFGELLACWLRKKRVTKNDEQFGYAIAVAGCIGLQQM